MAQYHMNKKEREITDREEVLDIMRSGKYATIAMCRENEPYAVTLSYGYDSENHALYFHSALKGLKLDFIQANPKVCATVIRDGGYVMGQCEHHYASVVFWGEMQLVERLEEKKHAFDILIDHLEEEPAAVKARIFKNDRVYDTAGILRLDIKEMTGKKGK